MIFHNLNLFLHYLNDYRTIPLKYFKTHNLTVDYINLSNAAFNKHDIKSVCSKFPVMFSLVYFEFLKRPFLPGDWSGNFGHYQLMLFIKKKLKFSTFSL